MIVLSFVLGLLIGAILGMAGTFMFIWFRLAS